MASPASASRRRPSSPSPWNEWGEVRGFQAPARSIAAPPSAAAWAVSSICSRDSAAQGPAITLKLSLLMVISVLLSL